MRRRPMPTDEWFDERAKRFSRNFDECPNDPWTTKSRCPHCLAEVLQEAYKLGEGVMRDAALEVVDDIFGADSGYYLRIKSRLEDL